MMDGDKRTIVIPIREFHEKVDSVAVDLSKLLSVDPIALTPDQIDDHLINIKSTYSSYNELSKTLTSRYIDKGSVSEAHSERSRRNTTHYECREAVKLLNMCRVNEGMSERSNIPDITNLSLTIASVANSEVNKYDNSKNIEIPLLERTSTPINQESFNEGLKSFQKQPTTSSYIPETGNTISNVYKTRLPVFTSTNITSNVFKPSLQTIHSGISSVYPNAFQQTIRPFYNAQTYTTPNLRTNTNGPSRVPLSTYSHYQEEMNQRHPPLNVQGTSYASNHQQRVNQNVPFNFMNADGPIVSSNYPPTSNEFYSNYQRTNPVVSNQGTAPNSSVNTNYNENYFKKMELLKSSLPPFNGEAHKFHAWMSLMTNELSNISLNSIDIIKILMANTTGEPFKLIEDLFYAGASNPDRALQNIWASLKRDFGSSARVAASLMAKIREFPTIKYVSQGSKVRELLHLCQLIESYIHDCHELHIFNLSVGLREIWTKLPDSMQYKWRSYGNNYEATNFGMNPTLSVFINFLDVQSNEICNPNYEKLPNDYDLSKRGKPSSVKVLKTEIDEPSRTTIHCKQVDSLELGNKDKHNFNCPLHSSDKHDLTECYKFKALEYENRRKILIEHNRCFRCTGKHRLNQCSMKDVCPKCNGKHISLMHNDHFRVNKAKFVNNSEVEKDKRSSFCTVTCESNCSSKSCSKTVLVELTHPDSDKKLVTYAILDDQSSSSFVDPSVINFFDVSCESKEYSLITLQGLRSHIKGKIVKDLQIRGVNCEKSYQLPSMLTNNAIPDTKNEIATPDVVNSHSHVKRFAKKFNEYNDDAQVLLLLGRNCEHILPVKCHGTKAPYVYETNFGFALVGNTCSQSETDLKCMKVVIDHEHFEVSTPNSIKSCKMPQLPLTDNIFDERNDDELAGYSVEDREFLKIMNDRVHIDEDGHITLPLPFKSVDPILPNNCNAVFCRTQNTLNRLKRDPEKLKLCLDSIQKNLDSKFIEVIPDNELETKLGKSWYLPIFPVSHPKKKLRLVFDSSATFNGTSLNDQLLKGPDDNNRLKGVLLRFRKKPVGFSSDVEAMFNQFHLDASDSNFLRFFWFRDNDPSKPLTHYRAKVHIFGNKPSPSVANFGLRFATTLFDSDPNAREFIHDNVYVDDGLCSTDTPEQAIQIIKSTRESLEKVGVRLCKIMSNSSQVLESFPKSEIAQLNSTLIDIDDSRTYGTLGLSWNTDTDEFVFPSNELIKPFTRRGILSTLNTTFDPLGFLSPVILTGRLIQRKILIESKSSAWDSELPLTYFSEWSSWLKDLSKVSEVRVPRSFVPYNFGSVKYQEIHTFADASSQAIACVSYLKSVSFTDSVQIAFISSSSKLSPKSNTSIPRLELCSVLEASLSTLEIAKELKINPVNVKLYTDSTIALGYINNSTKHFPKYISRRVSLITKCFPASSWQYVPTKLNPADIATRPISVADLSISSWMTGPTFLKDKGQVSFPHNIPNNLPESIVTEQVLSSRTVSNQIFGDLVSRFNSWNKIVRISSLVLKFCSKLLKVIKNKVDNFDIGLHDSDELAKVCILKDAQTFHYAKEINELKSNKSVSNERLSQLSPFLDNNGLIRVGGRLNDAPFPYDEKFPIIIPATSPIASCLVLHYHLKVKHQGRMITSAALKSSGYFVESGTKLVKQLISKCFICRRLRAPLETQKMSDLPQDRLTKLPPFSHSGIDVCGPFQVRIGKTTRNNTGCVKYWVLMITCLYSRASHTEVLPSLDTSSFINAYRRFISMRGPCKTLRSDCGSNFISANNINVEQWKDELNDLELSWIFNPPHASHFGGVWERKVGSFKQILNASLTQLGSRVLSLDEFVTLVAEATSIMNNTPLHDVYHDPKEPLPLTPSMLLTHKEEATPPPLNEFSQQDILSYGKNRYKRVQHLANYFWQRWKSDYISKLNLRKKWKIDSAPLKVNDIVLVREKNLKRNVWPVGRVVELVESKDGRIRSVIIKMVIDKQTVKFYERPIVDLVYLSSS